MKNVAKKDYFFTDREYDRIYLAIKDLDVDISMRDLKYVLNLISLLKERWIDE